MKNVKLVAAGRLAFDEMSERSSESFSVDLSIRARVLLGESPDALISFLVEGMSDAQKD